MNFAAIKAGVVLKGSRALLVTQKHSPIILTTAGILGGVTAAVLGAKATLKVEPILDKANEALEGIQERADFDQEYDERDRVKDRVYVYTRTTLDLAKLYGPAITVGAVSIGAIVAGQGIMHKRNAGLMVAYATLDRGFSEYRKRVEASLGTDKERLLFADEFVHKSKNEETGKTETVIVPSANVELGYARYFDECSSEWKRNADYNMVFLKTQQQFANDLLIARGHLFLNEVYQALGFEPTTAGQIVGWVMLNDGVPRDHYVDFGLLRNGNERFVNGVERSVLLDFNVDGPVFELI